MKTNLFLFIGILFSMTFCNKKDDNCRLEPDEYPLPELNITVVRMEDKLFALKNLPRNQAYNQFQTILNQDSAFANNFLERRRMPHDSIIKGTLYKLINDKKLDTLYQDCQAAFKDFDTKEQPQIKQAFGRIKHYFPDFQPPLIYTIVSGFGVDIFPSDPVMVLGLEYYLGPGARFRPVQTPDYILRRYDRAHLVAQLIQSLSNKYNQTDEQSSAMLNEMIAWGKSYYFIEKILPCTPDSIIAGYTGLQTKEVKTHALDIYQHFMQNKLFFNADHLTTNRYVGERPNTSEIGPRCPGRIGRWLGWQIVRAYAQNKKQNLTQIMAQKDAQLILSQSGYKPK